MPKIRAKFKVDSVEKFATTGEKVKLSPVYSPDKTSENYRFWTATPNGSLEMYINNPDACGIFEPGQEFYLDFTAVPKAATA